MTVRTLEEPMKVPVSLREHTVKILKVLQNKLVLIELVWLKAFWK
jgi:hypothetical protein